MEVLIVTNPDFNSSGGSFSQYFSKVPLSEAIGVTVFIISCISTLISLF